MKQTLTIKKLLLIFSLLAIVVATFNPTITGFATSDGTNETNSSLDNTTVTNTTDVDTEPSLATDLSLTLDAAKYAQDKAITGALSLTLLEKLNPEEELKVTIGTNEFTYAIEDVLLDHSYALAYEGGTYESSNGESEKTISFSEAGETLFGIQIPRYAQVEEVTFDIEGSDNAGSFPTEVSLDVGDEGNEDWFYLGDFIAYTGVEVSSADLDTSEEGTGFIEDNETYYCEVIDLPLGKHYTVSATYTKEGSFGDLQAVILSVPTGNPSYGWSGGADTCDLPETSGACEIELSYPVEGEYLVCLYSTGEYSEEEFLYSLPLDTSESTTTSYTCPTSTNSLCEETGFSNFFIYVEGAEYNDELSGAVNLEDWESFGSAILTGTQYYVGSEPYSGICKEEVCNVPIKVSSESAGDVIFKNLNIVYEFNGVTQTSATFYDLTDPVTNITEIESLVLEDGADITLDIEILDVQISELGDYTITVEFLGDSDESTLSIVEESDIYDAAGLADAAIEKYETFLDPSTDEYQVIAMLDRKQKLENSLESLNELKTQVGFVDENDLIADIENVLEGEAWDISFSQTSSDVATTELTDIPSSLGDTEEIYFMQDYIDVIATERTVTVENYADDTETYTFIHKEIEAKQSFDDATIYEVAPVSFTDLYYSARPASSSTSTGEYSLSLSVGDTKDYYYLSEATLEKEDFITIIVLSEETDTTTETNYICGDGICHTNYETESSCPEDCKASSFPIWIIIVIILIGGLLIIGLLLKDKIFKK